MISQVGRPLSIFGKVFSDIKAFIAAHPQLQEDFKRFLIISVIGERLAFSLLCLFRHYQGTNRAQMAALVGLVPSRKNPVPQ